MEQTLFKKTFNTVFAAGILIIFVYFCFTADDKPSGFRGLVEQSKSVNYLDQRISEYVIFKSSNIKPERIISSNRTEKTARVSFNYSNGTFTCNANLLFYRADEWKMSSILCERTNPK